MIPRVKIGNDIKVEFSVFRNESPESFDDAQDISISLKGEVYGYTITPSYSIAGNKITVLCLGEQQKHCDKYVLYVSYKKINGTRTPNLQPFSVDGDAFEIVNRSEETTIGTTSENLTVETIQLNGVISVNENGADGLNAFQVWQLQEGNEGKTIDDYLAWIQKPATDYVGSITFGYVSGKLKINY